MTFTGEPTNCNMRLGTMKMAVPIIVPATTEMAPARPSPLTSSGRFSALNSDPRTWTDCGPALGDQACRPAHGKRYGRADGNVPRPGDAGEVKLRRGNRSEEHTSELQSHHDLVCRLLLEKKKKQTN